jgi:hypothetical protein
MASRITAKGVLPGLIVGDDVIGAVQISLVDLLAWHERVDIDGVVALDRNGVELVVFERDVGVLSVLEAATFIGALNGLARDLVDQLLAQPVAGPFVDLPKRYPFGRG